MQPILIPINNPPVQIRLQVDPAQATFIKAWLNDVVDRLDTEYLLYNGTLIKSTELRKF